MALGATGAVLEDLAQQGFLNAAKTKNRKILNTEDLVHKWAEAFPALQTKTHIGTFTTDMPIPQDTIDLAAFGGCWGGEIAAAHYTNYLTHKAKMAEVMRATRLRKLKQGEHPKITVELFEPFWNECMAPEGQLAHPIVVFAELLNTGDPHNLDTAKRLYEEYIR